jgi:hypothetical protein
MFHTLLLCAFQLYMAHSRLHHGQFSGLFNTWTAIAKVCTNQFASRLPLQKLRQTATRLDKTLDTAAAELPQVASSVNLTSLELADCIVEFSQLSQEVTGGLRAGSRSIQSSEQALRAGGKALKQAFREVVLPGIQDRVKATGGEFCTVGSWSQWGCVEG